MKKQAAIMIVAAVIIVSGLASVTLSYASRPDSVNVQPPPKSLAQWYPPQNPEGQEYLFRMWELGGSMMGIITNSLQGDIENASRSFEVFSKSYKESSDMVPEWRGYYNMQALEKLGAAVRTGNPGAVMQAIPEIGDTCSSCHKDQKPYVWAEYYMKDFRKVEIDTPEGAMPFPEGKMKYLAVGFDGTMVNAAEGQKDSTGASFELFKMMFYNMKDACKNCHTAEPPRYFVSEDVTDKINETESQIAAGNFEAVIMNMKQIGDGCYRCHVIHESIQRLKEQMEKKN